MATHSMNKVLQVIIRSLYQFQSDIHTQLNLAQSMVASQICTHWITLLIWSARSVVTSLTHNALTPCLRDPHKAWFTSQGRTHTPITPCLPTLPTDVVASHSPLRNALKSKKNSNTIWVFPFSTIYSNIVIFTQWVWSYLYFHIKWNFGSCSFLLWCFRLKIRNPVGKIVQSLNNFTMFSFQTIQLLWNFDNGRRRFLDN